MHQDVDVSKIVLLGLWSLLKFGALLKFRGLKFTFFGNSGEGNGDAVKDSLNFELISLRVLVQSEI